MDCATSLWRRFQPEPWLAFHGSRRIGRLASRHSTRAEVQPTCGGRSNRAYLRSDGQFETDRPVSGCGPWLTPPRRPGTGPLIEVHRLCACRPSTWSALPLMTLSGLGWTSQTGARSLALDVGRLDDRPPFLDVGFGRGRPRVAVPFSRNGESTVMPAGEFNRCAGRLISIDRDR
jgi:hypothetical protein